MVNTVYCKSWVDDGWFDSIILFSRSQCWCGSTQGLNIRDHFHRGELTGRLLGNFLQHTLGLGEVAHLGWREKKACGQRLFNDISFSQRSHITSSPPWFLINILIYCRPLFVVFRWNWCVAHWQPPYCAHTCLASWRFHKEELFGHSQTRAERL